MKRSFYLLLCVMLVLGALTACLAPLEQHEHEYDTSKWESNTLMHWYAASCEHTEERASVGLHADANNDGACDVCAYGSDHVHTHEDEWSVDAENHWHAVSCGHTVEVADKAAHVDANNDSVCDTCSYDYGHTHTYNTTEWTTDADNHWHAVSCGHSVAVLDKAAHVDADKDGDCDVCAYVDTAHTHTPTAVWATDGTYHWYVCTEHEGYVMSKTAHSGVAADGVCDVCGWFDAEHTHTYAADPAWSYNNEKHWLAANCGHSALKTQEAAHADNNADGECDTCGWSAHEHTPDNTAGYQSNADQHWIGASCGCDIKFVAEAHKDKNNDGVCDICAWFDANHTHNFSDEWSKDENGHWHDTTGTCEHDLTSEYGAHEGMEDGVCDVCEYKDFAADHTHALETEYSKDYTHHWYNVTCSHTAFVEKAAHVDEDGDGECDVCLGKTFDSVIADATSDEYKEFVKNGYVAFEDESGSSEYYYEFGDNYLFLLDVAAGWKYWYHNYNDALFAMKETGAGVVEKAYTDPDMGLSYVNGLNFNTGYYVTGAYGLENTIATLYEQAANHNSYFNCYADGDAFVFEYDYLFEGYYSYIVKVSVSFEIGEAEVYSYDTRDYVYFDFVEAADIKVDIYEIDETGVVGNTPYLYYYYTVAQMGGEQNAVSPFDPAEYFVNSYDLSYNDELVTDDTVVEVELGKGANLYYANVDSKSGDFSFETLTFVVTDADGNEYYDLSVEDYGDNLYIGAYGAAEGTYTVTVTSLNTEKVIKVKVAAPALSSFDSAVQTDDGKMAVSEYNVFVGATLEVMSKVNANADASYSIAITSDNAADAVLVVPESTAAVGEWNYYYGNASTITFNAVGEYTIVLTSLADDTYTATLTVTVSEPPTIEELLSGNYVAVDQYMSGQAVYVTFTPDSEGATSGAAVINVVDYYSNALVATYNLKYSYDETTGISLTDADGVAFTDMTMVYENNAITVSWSYEGWWGPEYTSSAFVASEPYSPPSALDLVAGDYFDSLPVYYATMGLNIYDDNTAQLMTNPSGWENEVFWFTWEAAENGDGTVALTLTADESYNSMIEGYGAVIYSNISSCTATVSGDTVTLTLLDGTLLVLTKVSY